MYVCYARMTRLVKICKQRQLNWSRREIREIVYEMIPHISQIDISFMPLTQAPIKNKGMRTKESLLPLPYSGLIRNFPCHFLLI